jgi:DNA-binding beta-propeller fold protein YncE/mono/diheme cytochrome c family protein
MTPDVRVISWNIFAELSPLFGIRTLLPLVLTCILALFNHPAAAQDQPPSAQSNTKVSYFRQIRPVLQRQCQGCHQPASKQADLVLTSYEGFRSGGKSGPSFLAGKPDQSLVLAYLKGDRQPRMPLGGEPIAAEQIDLFRRWIGEGGIDDTPEAAREKLVAGKAASYQLAPLITAIAYSPDGTQLAVSGYREVLLHQADGSGLIARLLGVSDRVQSIVFSPDGKLLAAVGGTPARFGEVQIWDAASHELKRSVMVSSDTLFGASFSPDGSRLAVGCADNTIRVLAVDTGKELLKLAHHDNWVFGTAFSLDGKRLVSVGRDRAVKLTEAATGAFLENLNSLHAELNVVARHPRKDWVLVGGEDRIPYLYTMDRPRALRVGEESTLLRQLERQDGSIIALAFQLDGRRLAVGGAATEVRIYDTDTGQRVSALAGHEGGVYTVVFNPKGELVATGGFDGTLRIFETETGKLVKSFIPVPLEKSAVSMK